jgi:hypothetical protein
MHEVNSDATNPPFLRHSMAPVTGPMPETDLDKRSEEGIQMAKRLLVLAFVAVLALGTVGLAACGNDGDSEATGTPANGANGGNGTDVMGSITVEGSDTMVNLGQAFAEAFMDAHDGVDVSVAGGGSGTGIASLINGPWTSRTRHERSRTRRSVRLRTTGWT